MAKGRWVPKSIAGGGTGKYQTTMQSAEEFMREMFAERTALVSQELELRVPFRSRYFASDCRYDSRKDGVRHSESEEIISVLNTEWGALVSTKQLNPMPKLRYLVEKLAERWLVRDVEIECTGCAGEAGHASCVLCHGAGWVGGRNFDERVRDYINEQREKLRDRWRR